MGPAGGHEVDGLHCAHGDHVVVAAPVAGHPHRLHRQENAEGLGNLVVEVVAAQLLDEDVIRQPQGVGVRLLHLAQDPHPQPRARERVAVDHVVGQAELHADLAHLVLEQLAQRLHQPQLHVLGQPAHVVVGLDHLGLAGLGAGRLDDVGVDGALGQPLHVGELFALGLEHLDEGVADDLALPLRVADPGQFAQEQILGVDPDHLHAHVLGEGGHHLVALLVAQQAVVHEHAGELVADGPVQQRRHHRGVHPAGEPQQHLVAAHLLAHRGDGVLDDVVRRPQGLAAADVVDEAGENPRPLAGVGHLGMELHPVVAALVVGHAGQRRVVGLGDHPEAGRHLDDPVTVAHPHVQQAVALGRGVVLDILQQPRVAAGAHLGVAVLVVAGGLHPPAELVGHGLHAVADAEHRHAQSEHRLRRPRRLLGGDRLRPAGEDHAPGSELADGRVVHVPGVDLAVDPRLAHPPGNQLGVLGTEVEDQDPVLVDVGAHARVPGRVSRYGNWVLPW